MPVHLRQLSRTMAVALRHRPQLYKIKLDAEGWASLKGLINGIRQRHDDLREVTEQDIREVIATSDKVRYQIRKDKIRALHGHSTPDKIPHPIAEPPKLLYHGTSRQSLETIQREGLKPMSRQYVHLSADTGMANNVGLRKSPQVVILTIQAEKAHRDGILFYKSSDVVWLVDELPAEYIIMPDDEPATE